MTSSNRYKYLKTFGVLDLILSIVIICVLSMSGYYTIKLEKSISELEVRLLQLEKRIIKDNQ